MKKHLILFIVFMFLISCSLGRPAATAVQVSLEDATSADASSGAVTSENATSENATLVPLPVPDLTDTPTLAPTNTPEPTETPTLVPTNTPVPTKTSTDMPEPTSTPTATDTPEPLPTDTPTMMPLGCGEGWVLFDEDSFGLCLPIGWAGGSDEALDAVINTLEEGGPQMKEMASYMRANQDYITFWAYDMGTEGETNVNIGHEDGDISTREYMAIVCQQVPLAYEDLGGTAACIENKVAALGSYEDVGQLVVRSDIAENVSLAIQYLYEKDGSIWYLTFTTDEAEFPERREQFEYSASTLRIKPSN